MRRLKVSTLILVVSFSFAWSQTAPEFGQIWHKQGTGPLIHVQGDSGSWNGGDIAFDWSFGHVLQDNDTLKLYIGAFDGTVYSIGMYYSMNIDSGWVEHPSNPIMSGTPSAWDSVNVGGPMVIKQNGEYKMWYMGNGSHGTYASRVLGYATSSNGVNWDKHPSPVIDSEDFPDGVAAWVRNPFVISEPDTLKMWFCTSPGFADDEDIHYAWSLDGIDWVIPSTEPVIPAPRNRWVEFPCVKKIDGKYVMWFGEGLYGDSYKFRTKTAISTDGINWRYDNLFNPLLMPGSLGEYDEDGVAILDVIEDGGVSWALTGSWRVAGEYTDIGLAKYNPTIVPSGDVSGTWTKAGSPIRVQGEITIPNGETLTIEPGTTVEFLGHHQLNVQGRILAQGTEADPIFFMVDDTLEFSDNASSEGVWGGIRFDSTPVDNDSSYFQHCEIAYAKTFAGNAGGLDGKVGGGMLINYFSKVRVESCVIQHNRAIGDMSGTDTYGAGICVMNNSNPEIINNLIQFNTTVHLINNKGAHGGGILIGWNSDPKIVGNTFRRNRNSDVGAGIAIWGNCYPLSQNNLIVENVSIGNNGTQGYGGGVGIGGASRPIFINNTIANNIAGWKGGGFYSNGGEAVFINTIIANNHLTDNSAAPSEQIGTYYMNGLALEFYNSCLEDGEAGIDWGINANEVGDVVFENSIEVDPGLIGNYTLSPFVSQCFGAGTTSCIVDGVTYNALPQDINGHACPDPPGSQPDMGAIESNRSGHYISGGWNWWQPHGNPVFLPGAAGTYDDVSLIAPDVLFHDGQYHMWYGGYDGNRIRICQATSADGVEWVKNSANPILTGDPDTWQGSSLNLPRVIIVDEVYHMWFSTNDRVG
nr:hypothetical protein [FCB group bacterium]